MTAFSRASLIARSARLAISVLADVAGTIAIELRRLNRARMDSAELANLAPREQRIAVKAALAAHHRNSSRCC
ncbi:MAG TPA: hypothetical protein VJX23_15960 [Candidatus Binataceae bacterium]|nr:hypothetical protein [Candidatus Binataceae bacterium]